MRSSPQKALVVNPIVVGVLTALTMTLGVGPGLLLYFQASVSRGFFSGLAVLSGLWVSDFCFIAIGFFGVAPLLTSISHQRTGAFVCAGILFIFGLVQLAKKPISLNQSASGQERKNKKVLKGFLAGFLINSSNPFVLVFWMTLMGFAGVNFGVKTLSFYAFFIGLISFALFFDITKCFIFSKISIHLNPSILGWIQRIAGVALILAAVFVLGKTFLP
jgi:threonine/homoserine/homoserine lactone efflux protein